MRILFISLLILLFSQGTTFGQLNLAQDSLNVFSTGQIKEDFLFLRKTLEKVHPSLYRYHCKDTIDQYFNLTLQSISRPLNENELWQYLQTLISKIGCGHTIITPSLATLTRRASSSHLILPFNIYIRDNKIFVRSYLYNGDTSAKIGDQLLSINGEPVPSILSKARDLCSGDGVSNALKDYHLENGAFNGIYNILYGERNVFVITINSRDAIKKLKITAFKASYAKPRVDESESQQLAERHHAPTAYFLKDVPSTAWLTVPDFIANCNDFFRRFFSDIENKGIKNLILDLRGNGGGYDRYCIDFMKYLIDKRFIFSRETEGFINPFSDFKDGDLNYFLLTNQPRYIIRNAEGTSSQSSSKHSFKGNLYLLTNGGTFSAAALLAVAIKFQRKCFIIGSETGGGLSGCDGLKVLTITLPNTRLQLKLPTTWVYSVYSGPNTGEGLKPDVRYEPGPLGFYNLYFHHIDPLYSKVIGIINDAESQSGQK